MPSHHHYIARKYVHNPEPLCYIQLSNLKALCFYFADSSVYCNSMFSINKGHNMINIFSVITTGLNCEPTTINTLEIAESKYIFVGLNFDP